MARKKAYDNTSISMLKDEERVRKRPAVIFGSDDLEGCKHAVFEILSKAGAALWIGTRRKSGTTGSWCSVKCMPAANMTPAAVTMSFPWA